MEKKRKSKGVTRVNDFDLLILKNFGNDHHPKVLASYYVMPRYEMSLS
jgi:hypothetical protein